MQAHELLKPWHELQADSSERLEDIPWLASRAKIGPGNNPITVDANGQFESTLLFQQGEHPTWKSWDLTNLTQKWVTTPSSNNGVILWATNEDVNSYDLRFYSSEHENKRPQLMTIWSNQPKTVYFLKDHLGSIRATVLDSAGAPVVGYSDYDPWGYILAKRDTAHAVLPAATRNKFTGKEWDDEFGVNWNYFGARYYDTEIGRWMVRDPLVEKYPGWSPYVYALNNPLKYVDPYGKDTRLAKGSPYRVVGVGFTDARSIWEKLRGKQWVRRNDGLVVLEEEKSTTDPESIVYPGDFDFFTAVDQEGNPIPFLIDPKTGQTVTWFKIGDEENAVVIIHPDGRIEIVKRSWFSEQRPADDLETEEANAAKREQEAKKEAEENRKKAEEERRKQEERRREEERERQEN